MELNPGTAIIGGLIYEDVYNNQCTVNKFLLQ
jgi:hypothetical protein